MPTDPEVRDELVATVRRFVEKDVIPVASDLEHADEYPEALVATMKELGLFGVTIPEEHGGLGLDLITYVGGDRRARRRVDVAHRHPQHPRHVGEPAEDAGHARSRRRGCCRGSRRARSAVASRSPSPTPAPTRARSKCRAERDGDEYVVTGTKTWVTNGVRAGLVALAARTEEGITCFMVEKDPGERCGSVTVSRNIPKLGYKGLETVEMSWDGHRIPADSVLGGEAGLGRGQHFILSALEVGRINIAARAVRRRPRRLRGGDPLRAASARRSASRSRSTRRSR